MTSFIGARQSTASWGDSSGLEDQRWRHDRRGQESRSLMLCEYPNGRMKRHDYVSNCVRQPSGAQNRRLVVLP